MSPQALSPVEALSLLGAAVSGTGLVGLAVGTARPVGQVATRDGYLDRWQVLHGGYDPRTASIWVRGWLRAAYTLARPLARRGVLPDVVTLSSLWLGGVVVLLCALGGRWELAAGLAMVASGMLDNLDGCVAVLTDRTTRWGYVLDSLVDRASDSLYLVAAVLVGCPVPLAVAAGFGCFLLEYLRARAGNAGGGDVGRITVGERPARVILLSATVLACGALPGRADVLSAVGPAALLALTTVSLAQLGMAVRRQLHALPAVDVDL